MIRSFVAIDLETLLPETTLGLDLYIQRGTEYFLYCKGTLPFTEAKRQTLLQSGHFQVYIEREQAALLQRYIETHLREIIANPNLSTEKKSRIVYDASTALMEDLFADPRSGDKIARSREMIKNTVDLIVQEKDATRHLVALSAFDYKVFSHSVNVMIFGLALTERFLGTHTDFDLGDAGLGFLLHDLGKSRISPAILNKPGELNEEEWKLIRMHPEYGSTMLKATGVRSEEVHAIVMEHHEKYVGGGYPSGKSGEHIHILARICAMADAFDALTTRQPYREARSTFEALKIMSTEMKGHFDPRLFGDFVKVFQI